MAKYYVYDTGFGSTSIGYVDETGAVYSHGSMVGKINANFIYDSISPLASAIGCVDSYSVYRGIYQNPANKGKLFLPGMVIRISSSEYML